MTTRATIRVSLTPEEVGTIRLAISDRLDNLAGAEMTDEKALALVKKITSQAERAWKIRYQQRYEP